MSFGELTWYEFVGGSLDGEKRLLNGRPAHYELIRTGEVWHPDGDRYVLAPSEPTEVNP